MRFLVDVWHWFTTASHWQGTFGVPHRVFEHVELCLLVVVAASLLAVPVGVLLGHSHRGGFAAAFVANVGRAIPSFAILALALPFAIRLGLGLGFWPTFMAMFLLAIPPMFINSFTGVTGVDPNTVEAARGMGMREREVILAVEVPVALPLIIAGVRVAAVQVVATATLGALVAWGGLGRFIIDGLAQRDFVQTFAGALLVALLSVATELGFGLMERATAPA